MLNVLDTFSLFSQRNVFAVIYFNILVFFLATTLNYQGSELRTIAASLFIEKWNKNKNQRKMLVVAFLKNDFIFHHCHVFFIVFLNFFNFQNTIGNKNDCVAFDSVRKLSKFKINFWRSFLLNKDLLMRSGGR